MYNKLTLLLFTLLLFSFSAMSQTNNKDAKSLEHINTLMDEKKYDEAVKQLNAILSKDAENEEALYLLARVAYEVEEYNMAEEILSALIEKHPNNQNYYGERGLIKHATARFQSAIDDYKRQVTLLDNSEFIVMNYTNQGSAYVYLREFDSAIYILRQALALDSSQIGIWNNLANAYQEADKKEEALYCLNKLVALDPNFVGGYINLGLWYQHEEQHKKAIAQFNKAISIDPQLPLGYSNRAYSYLKTNKVKEAMMDINKSIQMYPSNAYAYRIRGEIYLAQKDQAKACEDWQLAVKLKYTEMYGDDVERLLSAHCK